MHKYKCAITWQINMQINKCIKTCGNKWMNTQINPYINIQIFSCINTQIKNPQMHKYMINKAEQKWIHK